MTIEITKRGNVRVDGEKFYAVSDTDDSICGGGCIGHGRRICHLLPCSPGQRGHVGYRLRGTSVVFVTREEFLKRKESSNAR